MTESQIASVSTHPAGSPALTLLSCARELEKDGHMLAARNAYQAAALSDKTPHSRVELGNFQFRTEHFTDARAEFESLLRRAAETGDDQLAEVACHNLAAVLRVTGEATQAATLQSNASRLSLAAHGEYSTADLTGRALDAILQGDFGFAESLLLRSLSVEQNAERQKESATACANLGVLALLRGDTAVAIRFLARAYHSHLRLKDHSTAGQDLLNLAEAFRAARRWSLAERCLIRAVSNFEQSGAEQSLETTRVRLDEVRRVQNVLHRDPLLN